MFRTRFAIGFWRWGWFSNIGIGVSEEKVLLLKINDDFGIYL